ncbi:MAG TPA: pitrilysin family protein, partial [Thermoanaerobaculia bacterium]|nr:pitrilysin family protein [Thermoanaerobaculia bacterium]
MRIRHASAALVLLALLLVSPRAAAPQDLASFERRVSRKVLANGLTVLVCERPEAPVFSFFTHVDVGADREVPGITGLAHMFEHMAFKGTDTIGTTDYAAEKAALEKVEAAYADYDTERRRPVGRDEKRVAELAKAWKDAIAEADRYVVRDQFGEIVDREGGVGMNAFTNSDETGYFYSFPSNRLELWAFLESERFLKPVMREFYKERDVVTEERRMRTNSNPIGRLIEQFEAAAFTAHPYGQPVIGWPSDLQAFSATDARAFYERYYVPANIVVAVVGDVKGPEALSVAEEYFGRLPARPKPGPLRTVEPPQRAEREVILRDAAQPLYAEGYHRGDVRDPDNATFDALADLLSNGRTSRLYRSLVRDKKIAAASAGFNGFPGEKYPNLFVLYAFPTPGHTPEEVRDAIRAEIERLKTEPVTDDELRMVKTRAKADLIRRLGNNEGLAIQLATAESRFGDWREVFRQVDRIERVTKEDLQRVAKAVFVPENRT